MTTKITPEKMKAIKNALHELPDNLTLMELSTLFLTILHAYGVEKPERVIANTLAAQLVVQGKAEPPCTHVLSMHFKDEDFSEVVLDLTYNVTVHDLPGAPHKDKLN